MTTTLYALTLSQPFATLLALGVKHIETRTWAPSPNRLGQLLAIHASKTFSDESRLLCREQPLRGLLEGAGATELPRGAIVAVGRLADRYCIQPYERNAPDWYPIDPCSLEHRFGGFSPGRWLWYITDIERLVRPVPARGYPQLFEITGRARHDALSQTKWGGSI